MSQPAWLHGETGTMQCWSATGLALLMLAALGQSARSATAPKDIWEAAHRIRHLLPIQQDASPPLENPTSTPAVESVQSNPAIISFIPTSSTSLPLMTSSTQAQKEQKVGSREAKEEQGKAPAFRNLMGSQVR